MKGGYCLFGHARTSNPEPPLQNQSGASCISTICPSFCVCSPLLTFHGFDYDQFNYQNLGHTPSANVNGCVLVRIGPYPNAVAHGSCLLLRQDRHFRLIDLYHFQKNQFPILTSVTTAFDCLKSRSTTNFSDFSDLHAHVPVDMSDLVDFLSEYKTMAPLVIWHFHMSTLSVHLCTMDLDTRPEFS